MIKLLDFYLSKNKVFNFDIGHVSRIIYVTIVQNGTNSNNTFAPIPLTTQTTLKPITSVITSLSSSTTTTSTITTTTTTTSTTTTTTSTTTTTFKIGLVGDHCIRIVGDCGKYMECKKISPTWNISTCQCRDGYLAGFDRECSKFN